MTTTMTMKHDYDDYPDDDYDNDDDYDDNDRTDVDNDDDIDHNEDYIKDYDNNMLIYSKDTNDNGDNYTDFTITLMAKWREVAI